MEEVRENHFLISRMRLVGPTSILLQEVEISPEAGPVYRSESLVSLSRVQRSSARTHTDYNLQKMLMENGLTHHPYLREVPNCFEASEALEVELDKFGTIIFYPCADYAADLKRE